MRADHAGSPSAEAALVAARARIAELLPHHEIASSETLFDVVAPYPGASRKFRRVAQTSDALFLAAQGIAGEEFQLPLDPDRKWVSVADGTRIPPDMEDRAAKYLPAQNLLLINADFRIFTDMITRWSDRYGDVAGVRATVEQVVREWFEQQLVEAVLGGHSLRGSREWTVQDLERLWSEEALTAVVLPRYHIDYNIKRVLGSKLGPVRERAQAVG